MNRRISTINGVKYHYWIDRIYINKGVLIPVSFSMGRADTSTQESLNRKKQEILQRMIKREAEERTHYWIPRTTCSKIFSADKIATLEKQRTELMRGRYSLGEPGIGALETAFLIDFVYNSNRMEGSRLPRKEVQTLLAGTDKVKANNEVVNTARAKEFLYTSFNWNLKGLKKLQGILLAHEPDKIGVRTAQIVGGNDNTLPEPEQIPGLIKKLVIWVKQNQHKLYPPEFSFEFYFRFERIHPFNDGNGRIGRLLMNKLLKDAKYHPIIIWDKNRVSHFNAFLNSTESEYRVSFYNFMVSQMEKTYLMYSGKIGKAIQFDALVNEFLSPSE